MMDKKVLIIERSYEAPIEMVWEAITDKDQMKQWYFEVSDFKAEVGFEFHFYGGGDGKKYLHRCTVVDVVPLQRISYTWRYEGYPGQSLVTFELFPENQHNVRLKLTHADIDTFPTDDSSFSAANFSAGWNTLLGESLRNFVETDSFTKSINIRANVNKIWEIVRNPNYQWGNAFGGGAFAETDWKEGSSIIWRDTDQNIGAIGIVEMHQPAHYLQLHYYDELEPSADTPLGNYYEKITLTRETDDSAVLFIEIGKMAKSDIPIHKEMWDNALNIIKELAEK